MNESKKLARFLAGLTYEDLSNEVIDKTKDAILDQLGVELAASTKPWSMAVYKYIRGFGGSGESTIVNYGDKVRAENAAFANASFGHGFEIDDAYNPGNTHPGCVTIPTALALGERELTDGKTLLLAVVSGYEAMGRIARSVAPSCSGYGFHSVPVSGPFAAAVATGKVLGFSAELMLNALSIAGSHSAGLKEFTQTGGNVKRMHAGMGAFNGIRAALLAQAGLTGPPTILEGGRGFCRAFSRGYHLDELVSRLGEDFVMTNVSFKRHCCCYHIQAPIEATSGIVKEHGIRPNDIEEIVMGTTRHGMEAVGTILEPKEVTAAQFSATFSVAMCVVKGSNDFHDYCDENLDDPEIKGLARRVRLEVDDEVEAMFPAKRAIKMTVKLKDGTSYQKKLEGARGTPENPMTSEEVKDKFRHLAAIVLPAGKIDQIIETVAGLDDLADVSILPGLLVR